jgi:hypothetical protein
MRPLEVLAVSQEIVVLYKRSRLSPPSEEKGRDDLRLIFSGRGNKGKALRGAKQFGHRLSTGA